MDTATKTKTTNRAAATQHTAAAAAVAQVVAPSVQCAPRISSPHDPAEKEADATAKQVMRMSVPDSSVALVPSRSGAGVYRQVGGGGSLQSPHVARFAHLGLFRAGAAEEKEPIARAAVAEEKEPIQRAAAAEEKEPIQRAAAAEEKEPIQRAAAPEEKEPIQRAAVPEEKEPIQRAAVAEEKEPIQRAAAAEEKEPIQRAAAPEEKEPIQRAAAAEEKEPIQRAAAAEEKEPIQRAAAPDEKQDAPVQRKAEGQVDASSNVGAEINSSLSSGEPLPASVRRFMEPRFGADFSGVRMHTDARAAKLNKDVSARAFAYGNHIFFGDNQFQPHTGEGRELIAHELTHTVQQRGAVQRRLAPNLLPRGPPAPTIAQPSSSTMDSAVARQTVRPSVLGSGLSIQRRETPTISQRGPPSVQRLGVRDALNYFADAANAIPGYRMFTIVLGVNPINMSRVERSAANILRAVVEFIPGGNLIVRALDAYGIFDRVGGWVEQQLRALGITGSSIRNAINRFLDSLSWRDIFRLGSVWNRAKSIFTDPISRILSLLRSLGATILGFIRDAVLRPLAGLASRTRGWDLLCAVLGSNPITGEAVPRTAETIIGGFMKLIGQEEIWNNIKKANAIARAWAWFQGALGGLMGFVRQIPSLFMSTLRSLEIADLVLLPRAFVKVGAAFAGFAGRFLSWALGTVMDLLQIIFEVVAPGVMPVLRRAAGAFQTIIRNPIGFVRNLVRAGIQGFRQFAGRFLTHLRASIIGWLTGAMSGAGVYIPQAFTLQEILKFVLSVLGLTWQNIRVKLVRAIGETAVRALEVGFDLVKTLVTQGPAAAWQQILESLTNLREMVMEQVMNFVATRIVQAAITRLVTSLNPAGAFIQAILAIYNTVMFFIERLRQIAQVATAFINSIAAIASGNIAAAANRVEQTMAGMLTLVISFLARLVGLGRVSDAVTGIINRVRAPIDRALDRVVAWIVAQARRLGRLAVQTGRAIALRFMRRRSFSAGGEAHQIWLSEQGEPQSASRAMTLGQRLAGWQRRVGNLSPADRGTASNQLATASTLNEDMKRAAADALRARAANNAAAVDAAQAIIDQKQQALIPVLSSLFALFGDTRTASGAAQEAEIFALVETYDRVVVPLKRRGLVSGTPATVSRTFRSQWNSNMIAQARGWLLQMERVLAAARNVGTGRTPYLLGVEVRVPGTEIDYTVRERDEEHKVDVDVAIEVKRYGAMRERTARSGRVITVAEQIQQRINTIRNQIQSSILSRRYSIVRLEMRGFSNTPPEMQRQLHTLFATLTQLATQHNQRFVWTSV